MPQPKILTRHPAGKAGVSVSRHKYDAVRDAIVASLDADGDMPYSRLAEAVGRRLPPFDGSVRWYTEVVKVDLEARGVIQRLPDTKPQLLRLVSR